MYTRAVNLFERNRLMRLTKEQRRTPFLLQLLMTLVLMIAGQVFAGILVGIGIGIGAGPQLVMTDLNPDLLTILALWGTIFTIVATLLYGVAVEKRSFMSFGFTKKGILRNYLWGLLIGTGMISSVFVVNWLFQGITVGVNKDIPWLDILLIAIGFGIQGLSEEVLCRGYLMNGLTARWSPLTAILVNSIVFAVLHMGNSGLSIIALLNLFLVGFVFSYIFYLTENIWIVGALHSVWNFLLGSVYGVEVSGIAIKATILQSKGVPGKELLNGGTFGFEGGLPATFVISIVLAGCYVYHRKKVSVN